MAGEPQWMTMEESLKIAAETVEEDRVLNRIKLLAQEFLPIGWQNWKTLDLSKESLFGSEQEIDPQTLIKLRFALPTVGLAQAFNPGAVDLPEKQYKDLKVSMLNWSFCRGLIMSPPALVNKLKGSLEEAEIFMHAIEPVKPFCISRIKAAERLRQQVEESQSENLQDVKRLSEDTGNHSAVKRSEVAALQDQMNHMFEIVFEKIQKIEQKGKKRGREESEEGEEFESSSEPSSDDDSHSIISSAWTPLAMEDPPINPSVQPMNNLETLLFDPQVKEKESLIPPPTPEIKVQGIACQKLGSASWNKIKYKEVQKKLHASPVFDSLKINTQLEGLVSQSYNLTLLERMDELTGTLTHGLLKQRQNLMEGMESLATKHPEAYNDIKGAFLGDSQFKETSDDLLQFTCARRAEVIEMRRKVFKPSEQHHAAMLAEIPPSKTHLFDEELLSKFLDQQGGLNKVFPQSRKPFTKKPSFYESKDRFFRKSSGSGSSSFKKPASQPGANVSSRKQDAKELKREHKKRDCGKKAHKLPRA